MSCYLVSVLDRLCTFNLIFCPNNNHKGNCRGGEYMSMSSLKIWRWANWLMTTSTCVLLLVYFISFIFAIWVQILRGTPIMPWAVKSSFKTGTDLSLEINHICRLPSKLVFTLQIKDYFWIWSLPVMKGEDWSWGPVLQSWTVRHGHLFKINILPCITYTFSNKKTI